MGQPITDYPAFFEEAKVALCEVNRLRAEEERLRAEEERARNALYAERKALKNSIEQVIETRLTEINQTYDSELLKSEAEQKKIRENRERAKNIGIKDRIKEETAPILCEIDVKKKELKDLFREKRVNPLFRTRLYFSLYFPHKIGQWLTLLTGVFLFFVCIPCAAYFFALPEKFRHPFTLILIYVADILVFGGIYVGIGNASKLHHLDTLRQGSAIWDGIDARYRAVKKLTGQIKRDRSEEKYDLASYDDELTRIAQKIQEVKLKKEEALSNFHAVTKNILTDELTQNAQKKLDELRENHEMVSALLQETGAKRQKKTLELADRYEVYLGKEFMSLEKMDALQKLVESGEASNLSEAANAYRAKRERDAS